MSLLFTLVNGIFLFQMIMDLILINGNYICIHFKIIYHMTKKLQMKSPMKSLLS